MYLHEYVVNGLLALQICIMNMDEVTFDKEKVI